MQHKAFHSLWVLVAIVAAACQAAPLPSATPTAPPPATLTATPRPSLTPLPSATPAPLPTQAPSPTLTRTTQRLDSGLAWTECAVPDLDYAIANEDILWQCAPRPIWGPEDDQRVGQKVETYPTFYDLRISIGKDHYETRLVDMQKEGCCTYQLIKNGAAQFTIKTVFGVTDPNRNFWNIGGSLVWELANFPDPQLYVDGVNYNAKYQLEGAYFPYEIQGKLIYIAKKDGKLHVVYDDVFSGPAFDEISMPFCCGMVRLQYGSGQYWFLGKRGGQPYLVSIQ